MIASMIIVSARRPECETKTNEWLFMPKSCRKAGKYNLPSRTMKKHFLYVT